MPRPLHPLPILTALSLLLGAVLLIPRHPVDRTLPVLQPILHPPPVPLFHATLPPGSDTLTAADALLQSREIAGLRHLDRLALQQQVRTLAGCDTIDACGLTPLSATTLNALLHTRFPAAPHP